MHLPTALHPAQVLAWRRFNNSNGQVELREGGRKCGRESIGLGTTGSIPASNDGLLWDLGKSQTTLFFSFLSWKIGCRHIALTAPWFMLGSHDHCDISTFPQQEVYDRPTRVVD